MRRFFLFLSAISLGMLMAGSNLSAQEFQKLEVAVDSLAGDGTPASKRVVTNGFWSNWSLSATIGTQFYFGENEKYMAFKDLWSFPAFDIYLNKWVTPSFGWGLSLSGYKFKGICHSIEVNNYAAYRTDELYGHFNGKDYYWQRGEWLNPYVYFTLDLASIFNGYKENRFWEPQLYAGGGIAIGFDKQFTRTAPTFNAGFINNFRITDKLAIVLNLRGALVGDDFDGESRGQEPMDERYIRKNIPLDGIFGATVGLRIKFGERKHQTFVKVSGYEEKINAQKEAIAVLAYEKQAVVKQEKELKENLAETRSELVAVKAERDTLVMQNKQKALNFRYHINFDLDKTFLTNREILDLQFIADVMKQDESRHYYLIGYADRQTGNAEHNVWLSEQRVNRVFDCLTNKFGVKPEQLVKSYEGGVDTMFLEDNTLSRCVMIISKPAEQ